MIFNLKIAHSFKMCEIKCRESHKKLTTQYKFCLMDADAKRRGRFNADTCGLRTTGEGDQNLAKSCRRLLWMAPNQPWDNPLSPIDHL